MLFTQDTVQNKPTICEIIDEIIKSFHTLSSYLQNIASQHLLAKATTVSKYTEIHTLMGSFILYASYAEATTTQGGFDRH